MSRWGIVRRSVKAFQAEYAKVITRFTGEFISDFCTPDGAIIWEKVLKLNSGSEK
jgi:hypothetical protein